jgi:hypothetical protein
MMMGGTGMFFGECTSNTLAGAGSSAKRPRGGLVKVGHFHNDIGPSHFAKVVLSTVFEMLSIPTWKWGCRWLET